MPGHSHSTRPPLARGYILLGLWKHRSAGLRSRAVTCLAINKNKTGGMAFRLSCGVTEELITKKTVSCQALTEPQWSIEEAA